MKVLNGLKERAARFLNNAEEGEKLTLGNLYEFFTGGNRFAADISEITYFTCIKNLSEALGKMPVHLSDAKKNRITNHDSYRFLNVQPNSALIPIQFFTTMEYHRNHYGNGYAYINRNLNGTIEGLYILEPQNVNIWVNDTVAFTDRRYYYRYTETKTGKMHWFRPEDVIHVKSWLTGKDGLAGKCIREILAENMRGNKASQDFLNDLYRRGLTANAVVKYVGELEKSKQQALVRQITEIAGTKTDRVIPLPVGFDIVPLDLKLTDSQFYELKKYSALQVAAAFGIKPNHLNNYEKSSYANSAMQNLSFYIDTLLFNISIYEQELNRKMLTEKEIKQGLTYEFNVSVILRGDPMQQAEMLSKYVGGSVYKINEARRKAGLPPVDEGNIILVNGSYVKLQDIGKAYTKKGGEQV